MKFQIIFACLSGLGSAAVASSGTASLYGQCGGLSWTGPTTCPTGSQCYCQNDYYSQCLTAEPGTNSCSGSTKPQSSAAAPNPSTTTATAGQPTQVATGIGAIMSSSFTQYGAGDTFGSPNCNTASAACGWYSNPGFNAAVSENLYGVGPGSGAGPACGKCYKLTATGDQNGAPLPAGAGGSIVVKVNNLCPKTGNPLCSQNGLSGKNTYGANVNFDICKDDGAAKAFFGSSSGMALGHAVEVDCSSWSGSGNLTS